MMGESDQSILIGIESFVRVCQSPEKARTSFPQFSGLSRTFRNARRWGKLNRGIRSGITRTYFLIIKRAYSLRHKRKYFPVVQLHLEFSRQLTDREKNELDPDPDLCFKKELDPDLDRTQKSDRVKIRSRSRSF